MAEDKVQKTSVRRKRDKASVIRGILSDDEEADQSIEQIIERMDPNIELLKVKLLLVEEKVELLTLKLAALDKTFRIFVEGLDEGFKEKVIEILDKHVEQKFEEELADSEALSDKAEIKLHGIYHSEDTGVRIELDWNEQFIAYLRSKGVVGADDEQVVKHWLAGMLRDVENSIDGKKATDSDFL